MIQLEKIGVISMIISVTLLLLACNAVEACQSLYSHPKYNYYGGNSFSGHYLVELDKNTSPNAFIEFIHNNHLDNDIHIHRIIHHKFINAVSIEIKDTEKEHLIMNALLSTNVESISPVKVVPRAELPNKNSAIKKVHNLTAQQVDLVSPHRISQVDKVHNELKLTGEGLFIGVIDSGVDYYHPALGGGFGEEFKVVAGYDLVGDKWNSSDPNSQLEPDDDPLDDCGKNSSATGHGTHVSGIIAGFDTTNNFTGVAPGSKLGMWRVFSCGGSARSDVILHAMLMAYDAGVDIISMSIGSGEPWSSPKDVRNKVISRISDSGVSVVVSAGNNGDMGAFTTGAPGNSVSAFEVASVNNEYISYDGSFNATGVPSPIGYTLVNSTNLTMADGYLTPTYDGTDTPLEDACTVESLSKNVNGKIALVKRGVCTFTVKIANIAAAGATGVIIYDNMNEPSANIVVKNATIPIYFISLKDGSTLLEAFKRNTTSGVSLKFLNGGVTFLKSPYATSVSSFSSVGPTAELNFKPNIAAVGQLIYSTLPRYMDSWGLKQGTSMACPYVAGSIALYLQYHGVNKTCRTTMHEKFQNYAFQGNVDNSTSGRLDNPLRQGAGLVQVYDTILQTSHISPGQITFNDTFTTDYKIQNITITNYGLEDVSYRIFNNVSVSISPYNQSASRYTFLQPSTNVFDHADIEFSLNEVHLKSGQSQTIKIKVRPPQTDQLDHIMYGGFIQFDPIANNASRKTLHVPYFGIVGSQRDLPIIDKNSNNMTVKNNATHITYNLHDVIIYDLTLSSSKPISLLFNFTLISSTMVVKGEVLEESTQKVLGYAFPPLTYLQRDFVNNTKHRDPVAWNGQYLASIPYDILAFSEENIPKIPQDQYISVPSGNYSIRISALKQFGDISNVNDWESFIAGPIIFTAAEEE